METLFSPFLDFPESVVEIPPSDLLFVTLFYKPHQRLILHVPVINDKQNQKHEIRSAIFQS